MAASSLPLRGVFVPTQLIFHPDLPAAVLVTWIQLRCLAWKGWATPPMTLAELAAHIGIHPTRLHKHLAHLQDISAITLRQADHEKVILSFAEEPISTPHNQPEAQYPTVQASSFAASPRDTAPTSYFPSRILRYLSYEDDEQDPLYIKDNAEPVRSADVQHASNYSLCEPVEHAMAAK